MSVESLSAAAYLSSVPEAVQCVEVQDGLTPRGTALRAHLVDPSITAAELSALSGLDLQDVVGLYADIRGNSDIRAITGSPFYPRRLMTEFAQQTVTDWSGDPEYAERLLTGGAVAPRNLEVHATRGTCDYTCNMCLWSDKEELTYRNLGLSGSGLMTTTEWEATFQAARDYGTRRIVFSGGGEPLLNKGLFELSVAARGLGLFTQLYTNGFKLRTATDHDWDETMQMEQVRFSIHSPTEEVYDQIVEMPEQAKALPTIQDNISELLRRRAASDAGVRVGIGFVTQALNHHQIEAMVDFAQALGVDFINLRQDEVEVTRSLNEAEREQIAKQLRSIRDRVLRGDFGNMAVDMSDDLTALANGISQTIRKVGSCSVKAFRPAISPFGVVTPCDLRAEPRFSDPGYVFGNLKRKALPLILGKAAGMDVDASCVQCMPSGRTINAIIAKLLEDGNAGVHYAEQPF